MRKIIIGFLAAILILAVAVYAHAENEKYDEETYRYGGMHDKVEEVLESGTFEDLEELREEYDMPIMHWIDDEEDFEIAKEYHEESEQTPRRRFGGCHSW